MNDQGGVEIDCTVTPIESGVGQLHDPIFKGRGYYIVAGGASMNHTIAHLRECISEKALRAKITDVTEEMGVLSIQGPKSREILSKITDFDLSNETLPPYSASNIRVGDKQYNVRLLRISFVGEMGYELHIPKEACIGVYNALMEAGGPLGLRNAGYRSLYSLSSEKGYHLWGFDLRSDDTPIEANLGFTCRKTGEYKGKDVVERQRSEGVRKKLVYLTLNEHVPLWGLEAVYRNGEIVGHLRRGDFAYTLHKPIGQFYITRPENLPIDADYITSGDYQVEVMGKLYPATCHLKSFGFDVKNRRILGDYSS